MKNNLFCRYTVPKLRFVCGIVFNKSANRPCINIIFTFGEGEMYIIKLLGTICRFTDCMIIKKEKDVRINYIHSDIILHIIPPLSLFCQYIQTDIL